jgi:molybdopterin-guanine dinucleotide biosynthesis protein MobB
MRIIDVIGFSGSGKTYFIMKAIELFKIQLGYNVTVFKNVKHHQIDERGKDSHIFTKSGANYSIIQNLNNEMAIFLKAEEKGLENFIKWLEQGPYEIDIVFTEGFRYLNHPTVLCVSTIEEITSQISKTVKMISGTICGKKEVENHSFKIPVINIEENFETFLKIFNIP